MAASGGRSLATGWSSNSERIVDWVAGSLLRVCKTTPRGSGEH